MDTSDLAGRSALAETPVTIAPRMTWMDVLRGIAILAVVLFHSATLLRYAHLEVPEWLAIVNGSLAPYRIPMLMLLSGMLMPRSLKKDARAYIGGKARGIAWPYLLWSGLIGMIFWQQHGLASVKWLAPNVLYGGTYLWYLFFLLTFYLVALSLRRVPLMPVIVVLLVVAELMPDGTKYRERFVLLFGLFVFGWWLAQRMDRVAALLRTWWTGAVAVAVLILCYLFLDMSAYRPRAIIGMLAGVYLLAFAASRAAGLRAFIPLRFVGRNSIVFYVIHFPLIMAIMALGHLVGYQDAGSLVLGAAAITVAAGAALANARSSSPFVEALFTAPAWTTSRVGRVSDRWAGVERSAEGGAAAAGRAVD